SRLNVTAAAWSSSRSPAIHWAKCRAALALNLSSSTCEFACSQFRSPYFFAPRAISSAKRVRNCSPYGTPSGHSRSNRALPSWVSRRIPLSYSSRLPLSLVSKLAINTSSSSAALYNAVGRFRHEAADHLPVGESTLDVPRLGLGHGRCLHEAVVLEVLHVYLLSIAFALTTF